MSKTGTRIQNAVFSQINSRTVLFLQFHIPWYCNNVQPKYYETPRGDVLPNPHLKEGCTVILDFGGGGATPPQIAIARDSLKVKEVFWYQ